MKQATGHPWANGRGKSAARALPTRPGAQSCTGLRPAAAAGRLLRQPLSLLPRAARAAPVHRLPDGGYFLSRYADCVAVYKDARAFSSDKKREFAPEVRRRPALRAPHHQPRLQRSAAAHARAPHHRRRLHAARDRRHGAARHRAGRRPARPHRGQGLGRPHRRPRRRRAHRGDRQPAGGAARGARAAARVVARHPGRAGAGADAGAARARRAGGRGLPRLPANASWPTGARIPAIPSAMC